MKKFFYAMLSVATLLGFAACEPNNNGDNQGAELAVNTYSINGVVGQLQSVAVDMSGENIYIIGTPTANVASALDIFECEEYIFVAVSPLLVGKEFDLKTEPELYTVISTLSGAKLEQVTPEDNREVLAGTVKLSYDNGVAVGKATITLTNGKVLRLHLSAEKEVNVNENIIARGSEEKPLRAAFYHEEDSKTALHFTSGGIEYFAELEDAMWYLYIKVSDNLVDGVAHNIESLSSKDFMMFGMVDNQHRNSFEILNSDLQGATGRFKLSKNGEDSYVADIAINVNGELYIVKFDDTCTSALIEPPAKPTNFFTFKDAEYTVSSAILTQGEEVWSVEIATSSGKSVVLNAPKAFFNSGDGGRGFSQSADFTVEYDGTVYSKANGHRGTIISVFDEATQHLALDFFNNSDVEFNYTGVVEVK